MSLIKINYYQVDSDNLNSPFSIDGVGFEPELLVNTVSKNSVYWRCPAWKHKASRTFLIKSPVNITLTIHPEEQELRSPNLTQWQFDQYCRPTFLNDWCTAEKTTIQLTVPRFLFWTNQKNIWVETKPHCNTIIKNNLVAVPGWFNLSTWTRPIGTAFDVVDSSKPVVIKRGDPLMEVCFYSNNLDSGILLKKSDPPKKLLERMDKKGLIKEYLSGYSKYFIFKKQESKCPFHYLWKK